jgi:hypothetical protein
LPLLSVWLEKAEKRKAKAKGKRKNKTLIERVDFI